MMNRKSTLTLFVTIWFSFFTPASRGQATDWTQIRPTQLRPFHPETPKRIQLLNGMVIFLQEDHELPLIRSTTLIRGGSRDEPPNKIGLVQIYAQVWRTGGTATRTGDELDDYLAARGAKIETSSGVNTTNVAWDCLKDNFNDVFNIFREMLTQPEFRQDKVVLARNQLNTTISRRNENLFQIASREASKIVYGFDSPYARVPEYDSVTSVSREDLLGWYRRHVHPNNTILGIVGDFSTSAMETKLRQVFESWPRGPDAVKTQTTFQGPRPGIYFVQKDNVMSSAIEMVDLGTTRADPDYYAIEVFNHLFGGSMPSRLFSNIRTRKALAYAVNGGIGTEFAHPGMVRLFMETKSGATSAGIEAMNEEIEALATNPISLKEVTKAKDAILNSFVFRFDSKEKVLREQMTYELHYYPLDSLERYRIGIANVTLSDVSRVAKRYIDKNRFAILVVGNAVDFDRPLSLFGSVTIIDIAIPKPLGVSTPSAVASKN